MEQLIKITHLDENVCVLDSFDMNKLCRILERDPIVNDAKFIRRIIINERESELIFNINGNSTLKVDALVCEVVKDIVI